jgi:ribosome modulation factor
MKMWMMRVRMLLADVPEFLAARLTMWTIEVAVSRGRRAALHGHDHAANPYRQEKTPHLRAAWGRGYRQGIAELADPGGRA